MNPHSDGLEQWKNAHLPSGEGIESAQRRCFATALASALATVQAGRRVVRLTDRLVLIETLPRVYALVTQEYGDTQPTGLVLEFVTIYPEPAGQGPEVRRFWNDVDRLRTRLRQNPLAEHYLNGELYQLGTRPGPDGTPGAELAYWLFHQIGRLIQQHESRERQEQHP